MSTSRSPLPENEPTESREPSLDESLAQLEAALALFDSTVIEEDFLDDTHAEVTPIITMRPDISGVLDVGSEIPQVEEEATIQHLSELKQRTTLPPTEGFDQWAATEVVIAPLDEGGPAARRFPRFTNSQVKMFGLAIFFALFFATIGFLLWRQQKGEDERLATSHQEELSLQRMTPRIEPTSTPAAESVQPATAAVADDKLLTDSAAQILAAYNPSAAATRYKVEVKAGVLTLTGEAQSQMEKEGAENVVKPLQGISKVVNNLIVRSPAATPGATAFPGAANGPVMYPKVNEAEAKKLEEGLRRDLAEGTRRAEEERNRIEQQNAALLAQREEESRLEALRQRRIQAPPSTSQQVVPPPPVEEPAKRPEVTRKSEETRPPESQERSLRVDAVRPSHPELRSGTVTWSGVVKGIEDIVIHNSTAAINHVSGDPAASVRASFSAAIPAVPITVRIVAASGKAGVRIVQQPSAANSFSTVIRVGDGSKGDGKPTTFSLRWTTQ